MVAAVVVVVDEGLDLGLELAGQVVVLEQDAVLQGLVPALDLALGLGMAGRAADMVDGIVVEPFGEIAGDVAGPIVGQQARPVPHPRLVAARGGERHLQRIGDVAGAPCWCRASRR